MIAKCGVIVTWHWAHRADTDCDPWASHETNWHLEWKEYFQREHGCSVEVVMDGHRADVVSPGGTIVEFQSAYLSPDAILEREEFYGPKLNWIYKADAFEERIVLGKELKDGARGFRISNGPKSLGFHERPVYLEKQIGECVGCLWRIWPELVDSYYSDSERIIGVARLADRIGGMWVVRRDRCCTFDRPIPEKVQEALRASRAWQRSADGQAWLAWIEEFKTNRVKEAR